MFIARWTVDVRFGHRDEFLRVQRKWFEEVGKKVGLEEYKQRALNGSIGAAESRWEFEFAVPTLAALESFFAQIAKLPAHAQFGKDLEPHVVSGSNRWEILRLVEL